MSNQGNPTEPTGTDNRPTIGMTPEGFPIKDPQVLQEQLERQGQDAGRNVAGEHLDAGAQGALTDGNTSDQKSDSTPFVDPDAPRVDDGSTKVPTEVQPPLAQDTGTEQDPQPKESERTPTGLSSKDLKPL